MCDAFAALSLKENRLEATRTASTPGTRLTSTWPDSRQPSTGPSVA